MDAVVVGAGPNGLAAAITLARQGLAVRVYEGGPEPGGACRTAELTLPGHLHDTCSGVHPFAAGSPFLTQLPLDVEWVRPEVELAHPFDDGGAAVLLHDLDATVDALGEDGPTYRRLVGTLVPRLPDLLDEVMAPFPHLPRHPWTLARFGLRGVASAHSLARRFPTPRARGLLAGLGCHAAAPLERRFTGAVALTFAAAVHGAGWPFPRGGAGALTRAMADHLVSLGGEVVTGHMVESLDELPPARAVLLDLAPRHAARLAGDRFPRRYAERLRRYRHGPGAFKLDHALSEPVPWTAEACRRAGTVHLGGTFEEIAAAERAVAEGRAPERPFLLVAQPSLFDGTRAPEGGHVLWTYCHVPNGWTGDLREAVESQIERFAPGFRDTVTARHVTTPADAETRNPNLVGGDFSGGAYQGLQVFLRPTLSLRPYRTPDPAVFLCSASTPPGGGVHGMCGHHAARRVLRRVFGA